MSSKPLVSVVMGVYNDVDRLEHAVNSILAQSFRDLELIVIDDGSSDGSSQLLDKLAVADARMRVFHQVNTGLTLALIRGCTDARGEFIARQDSDDWSHPARIEEQLSLMESDTSVGFVSCATQYVGPADEPLCVVARSTDPVAATKGLLERREGPPAHGSVMFRKAVYEQSGGYRAEFYYAQDSDLWLRMAEIARIGYLPAVHYLHRKDPRSTSGTARAVQRRFGELGHLCRQARLAGGDEAPWLAEATALAARVRSGTAASPSGSRRALADANYLLGALLVAAGDHRARSYLWQAARLCPWRPKPWIRLAQSLVTGASRSAASKDKVSSA